MVENAFAHARALFNLPRDIAYLNCAYMSPLLVAAEAAGHQGLARKAAPWNLSAEDFFTEVEVARALFARLIATSADNVALIPAASYGLATALANISLARGQKIVLMAEDFPSAVLASRRLAQQTGAGILTVPRPKDGDWTSAMLEAIGPDTGLVCAAETHWICGGRVDLVKLGQACRNVGAALVLDLTQSLGVAPIAIEAIDPDFAACAGYKWLLGPYGTGFAYVAPRHHGGRPIEEVWLGRARAEDFRRLIDYSDTYRPGARRFDMGERSNFALLPAVIVALEQILAWQPARMSDYLGGIAQAVLDDLADLGVTAPPVGHRSRHYLAMRFQGGLPQDLTARLAAKGVYVSARGDRLRISPHVFNDAADITRFKTALRAALAA